jgi:hypothetical protein
MFLGGVLEPVAPKSSKYDLKEYKNTQNNDPNAQN